MNAHEMKTAQHVCGFFFFKDPAKASLCASVERKQRRKRAGYGGQTETVVKPIINAV